MTFEIALLLCIVAVALALFSWERLSVDVVALGVLLSLVFTGLLPAKQAFEGFGSDTVIMILGLLLLTAALQRTGVVELAGNAVLRYAGDEPDRLLLVVTVASAVIGAFISNTASTALFVPIVFGLAKKVRASPSKFLMPMAFASILTSSVTLVSTSTNMVVSGMITKYDLPPLGMFELAPVGIPISLIGLVYILTLGRRLTPERAPAESLAEEFGMSPYLSEIRILPESKLAGKTVEESAIGLEMGLTVMRIVRGEDRYLAPSAGTKLQPGDTVLVEGQRDELLKIKDVAGIEIEEDVRLSDPDLETEEIALAEAIVLPGSPLVGRSLSNFHFRDRHGLHVLAVNHQGTRVLRRINEMPLKMGDMLLLQGRRENIARLQNSEVLRILGPAEAMDEKRPKFRHAPLAVAIFAVALALPTFHLVSVPVAMMLGAFLVFLTGCITPEQAYKEVEWKAIILIGSMLGLGAAMEHVGAAKYLASLVVSLGGEAGPF